MRLILVSILLLASCSTASDQAIRHTVLAETIERLNVPESNIEIREVRQSGSATATARIVVQGPGARGGFQYYRATLARSRGHWQVRDIQPEP